MALQSSTAPWARPFHVRDEEPDISRERFADAKKDLLNNGDLFTLTQPKMIGDIHRGFWKRAPTSSRRTRLGNQHRAERVFCRGSAGARGAQGSCVLPEGDRRSVPGNLAWEINEQSARQCREWADRIANGNGGDNGSWRSDRTAHVSLSNSPDADDPGSGSSLSIQVRFIQAAGCVR